MTMVMRCLVLALSAASCRAYMPVGARAWTPAATKARHASAVAQGGPQGDEKFTLPGISGGGGGAEKFKFVNDFVKDMADKFGEQEKGFGLLTYSKDERTAQASHILLSFEAYPDDSECDGMLMGNALKQKILDGELTFELVAEKFSACSSAEKGGDLGTFKRGAMVPPFDEAVFNSGGEDAVPIGTLQGPIRTTFGHHLIKVVSRSDE